jgi:high-affinity nickel-transport protein
MASPESNISTPRASSGFDVRALARVFDDSPGQTRHRIVTIYALLISANVAAWALTFAVFSTRPVLLGTALLAYTFGLRHAVDADHISAIDNVTRKLMQEGKQPISAGLFFSLGHSTIVVALSAAIAMTAGVIRTQLPGLQSLGSIIGTSVSALFLYVIAAINLAVLIEIYRTLRTIRRGESYSDLRLDEFLAQRGLMARFFRPVLRSIGNSWSMYPVGVLFGLGFDTATEIGLLGIAAAQAGKGLPVYAIMIFPLLFTVGMCLLDTTDSILMLGAYGWAFVKPIRKLYYNLNITLISVLVALLVGTIEVLSIFQVQFALKGSFWDMIGDIGDNFGATGLAIIGLFIITWGISAAIYRLHNYDELEDTAA